MENVELYTLSRKAKSLKIAQRIVIFGVLFGAILVLLYSFIFMSPFSELYMIDGQFLFSKMSNFKSIDWAAVKEKYKGTEAIFKSFSGQDIGLNLAYFTSFTRNELQVFNHWLFLFGVLGLVASLLPFVFYSQKRKIYYKTNVIVNSAVGGFSLYIGIALLVKLINNQNLVWSQDFTYINAYQTYLNDNTATTITEYFKHSDSNVFFAIGYIIALIVILFALASLIVTWLKFTYQTKQKKIDLDGVHIHE